jgi:hypothetical protein
MDETTGLGERRARSIVTVVLLVEAVWVFLFKYLPLDAGLWSLQAELVRSHITGHANDGWRLIGFPASNVLGPLIAGLMTSIFSGEVVVRLLLTFVAIFLRGLGMLTLFRVLRVRDIGVIYLIPVLAVTGLWFTGALPYLMAETLLLWVLVFFLSQDHPGSRAYWTLSVGFLFVSLFSGLVYFLSIFIVFMIMLEQRRNVHLSQGWFNEPRAVIGLLGLGAIPLLLGFIIGQPVLRFSATNLLPQPNFGQFLFFLTPAPNVLEATFRYGHFIHILVAVGFGVVLVGCFARAVLLAIEEVTWQSRALRSAGYMLLVLALLGPLLSRFGIESGAGVVLAVTLILAGSYSRGPAVRRLAVDRLIFVLSTVTAIVSLAMNAYSIAIGSFAATDVLSSARGLVSQERESARQDEHLSNIRFRFVMDSTLAAQTELVATLSYSATAPVYLFTEHGILNQPSAFQPPGGLVRAQAGSAIPRTGSPDIPLLLGSEDKYIDSTVRILATLPMGTQSSNAFGPFDMSLAEDAGVNIDKGEVEYRLAIGKLRAGHPIELASTK